MKIFLDEQLHVRMQFELSSFNVFKPKDFGWEGLKNGELREKLNKNNFDFFIAADKNIPFQQNFQKIGFSIILIDTPTMKWVHQSIFVPKIEKLLQNPPNPLPKLIHISMRDISQSKKIEGLKKLLPSEQILFL